ncbi:MAG: prolipoprotein diacylglyceryl transferase [Verrucomicrobiota bacterium]|nr:prolipoprotein diacylglyceryl transferase [Verrucomicrobiota bacterium]
MYPALLQFPHISSYPVLLLFGFIAGYIISCQRARQATIERRHIDNLTLLALVLGLGGARLFARMFYMPNLGFWEIFKIWEGTGLVFYGGFLLTMAGVIIYTWVHHLALLRIFDLLAPGLAAGLAFGRIGCLLAGCCWGDLCVHPTTLATLPVDKQQQIQTIPTLSSAGMPLAINYPKKSDAFRQHQKLGLVPPHATHSLPVHPTPFYEAFLAAALTLYILRGKNNTFVGSDSIKLLVGYATIRFVIEFFRADNHPAYASMTISQVVSLGLLALGIIIYAARKWRPAAVALAKPQPT